VSSNRNETRIERYTKKLGNAKTFPISVATVNFMFDENLGFVVRSAACFGAEAVHVIGSTPNKAVLKSKSGSTDHFVTIVQHQTPSDFLEWCRNNNVSVVSAELNDSAVELTDYHPTFDKHVCIVVGHEETGVPAEISAHSDNVYIEMPGVGFCLNTSQTANIMLHNLTQKYRATNFLHA
jgi:tRNA G18 (ribose-2'-O)-methylase SpoU